MAQSYYVNTASKAQLASGINTSVTTITLGSFTGFPTSYPYWALINRGTSTAEVVQVTSSAGNSVTVVRAQDGTLAATHNTGESFEHIAPASHFNTTEAHVNASSGVHGITGAVVGTTDVQTVSSKSYKGGYVHDFADGSPTPAIGYEVKASSALARTGFGVTNTGGDSNQPAFALTQSGTPRWTVYNDGTVKVAPNSGSSRPASELNTNGTAKALKVTQADNANAETASITGAGDATVHNLTATGTANVTGSVTTGDLTANTLTSNNTATVKTQLGMPATVGDTNPRISVASNANQRIFQSFDQASVLTCYLQNTGDLWAKGKVTSYGSSWPMAAVVNDTAVITTPTDKQLAWNVALNVLYQYSSSLSAWVPVLPFGTGYSAEFQQTVAQTIANTTDITLSWDTTVYNEGVVSKAISGSGHNFTLQFSGVYQIDASLRYTTGGTTGERLIYIGKTDGTQRYADNDDTTSGPASPSVSITRRFNSGDQISIKTFQNSGGSKATDIGLGNIRCRFNWLHG